VWEKLHAVLFLEHVCTISQLGTIQNKLLCPDHHLDVPEVWTAQCIKGTNIGSNNLHPSLGFGDGVLMPKLAKKSEFGCPANVRWTKMETYRMPGFKNRLMCTDVTIYILQGGFSASDIILLMGIVPNIWQLYPITH
jgi:hypothetical protein